jgi:hypothetical protein
MSAASQEQLRLVRPPERPARQPRRWGFLAAAAVAITAAAAITAVARLEPRGLGAVPEKERAALYARTLDEVRQFCGAGHARALDDHCRELASFAARFDECGPDCEKLVRPLLTPTPTR